MSTIKVNAIQNTSGVEVYTAKAWVNFNGTGTVAIRAAGGVSSVSDNGVGDYTINFTTTMVDSNYSTIFTARDATANNAAFCASRHNTDQSTGATRVKTNFFSTAYSAIDIVEGYVAIFR